MKKALLGGFGILAAFAAFALHSARVVRADPSEQTRVLPGDELIPQPIGSVTHAITIRRSPHEVWQWLAQMGAGRGGWYAYDFVDNGGQPSASQVLPRFQNIGVGTVFPALPGATDVFIVARCELERDLVLTWQSPSGAYLSTWAFVLEEPGRGSTRLITRGRAGTQYRPYGLPQWMLKVAAPWAHFIMERKQLLGIARRAEGRA